MTVRLLAFLPAAALLTGCVTATVPDEMLLREPVPFEYHITSTPDTVLPVLIDTMKADGWSVLTEMKQDRLICFEIGQVANEGFRIVRKNLKVPIEYRYNAYLTVWLKPAKDGTSIRFNMVERRPPNSYSGEFKGWSKVCVPSHNWSDLVAKLQGKCSRSAPSTRRRRR